MKNKFELITVVLIAHKSKEIVLEFIDNLSKDIKILVIDNSNDLDLKSEIDKKENVKIEFMNNNGYGSAINYARTYINTKYFFIFSPDVKNIDDEFIEVFTEKLKDIKLFGALGPRFLNVTKKSHKQSNIKKEIGEINSISGAVMFFETTIFDDIDGFDENFFLYFEEFDLCRQILKRGGKIYASGKLYVKHLGHKGSAATDPDYSIETEMFRNWHWMWSSFYYYEKNYSYLYAVRSMYGKFFRSMFKMIIFSIFFNKKKHTMYYARFSGIFNRFIGKKSWYRVKSLFQ